MQANKQKNRQTKPLNETNQKSTQNKSKNKNNKKGVTFTSNKTRFKYLFAILFLFVQKVLTLKQFRNIMHSGKNINKTVFMSIALFLIIF
jgi:hypothetical protein